MEKRALLISGNEACVEGALYAGIQFYAGYPITPSSEIPEGLSRKLPKYGGVMIQMEDEIAAMAAIIGASLTGKKSMTATSGPGFSLKQENIGFASFNEIPCVIVNVMRERIIFPEKGELEVIDRLKPTVPPDQYKPFDVTNSPLPLVPPMAAYGTGYRFHVTGLNHRIDGFPTNNGELIEKELHRIMDKVELYKKRHVQDRSIHA